MLPEPANPASRPTGPALPAVLAESDALRIEAELATHRLDASRIAAAFESLAADGEADWPQRARDLLERRYDVAAFADDPALRRKAVDFLLRRGFDAETAYGAVRALRDGRTG